MTLECQKMTFKNARCKKQEAAVFKINELLFEEAAAF